MVEVQEGKFYRDGRGNAVGPMEALPEEISMIKGRTIFVAKGDVRERWYSDNGFAHTMERADDLVCESGSFEHLMAAQKAYAPAPKKQDGIQDEAADVLDGQLTIEAGKFYRTEVGDVVGPMQQAGTLYFTHMLPGFSFRVDGTVLTGPKKANSGKQLVDLVIGEELYDEVLATFGPLPGVLGETDLEPITKADILQEAIGTVAQRGEAYDGVEDNFIRIARYWNAHLVNRFGAEAAEKCELNAIDVAQMMILMKQARIDFKQDHHDSWVDTCGYGGCGGELAAKEAAE